jgi:hypothetical protein
MQNALASLESWSSKWLLKINEQKTTYTTFTLSNKNQVVKLLLNRKALREDETPTYLEVTLDQRMTWATHITKDQVKGKQHLATMKKLDGTSWGTDEIVLKKLHTGRVRPVLEYSMSAWSSEQIKLR